MVQLRFVFLAITLFRQSYAGLTLTFIHTFLGARISACLSCYIDKMPPSPQAVLPPSSPSRALSVVAITVVVILILIGLAWYTKLISFAPGKNTSLLPVTKTETAAPVTFSLGTYALIGRGAGQAENYAGTVAITKRGTTSNIYDLVWHITSGQTQSGVGILTNNVLSVGYYEALDGSVADMGVVSYKITDSSHLEGEWTSVVGGRAGVEQLSLQPQL